jgi:hypothetical protein
MLENDPYCENLNRFVAENEGCNFYPPFIHSGGIGRSFSNYSVFSFVDTHMWILEFFSVDC